MGVSAKDGDWVAIIRYLPTSEMAIERVTRLKDALPDQRFRVKVQATGYTVQGFTPRTSKENNA